MMLNIFSCAYWPFIYLLWRNVYSETLSFKNWFIYLFIVELQVFFIYYGFKFPLDILFASIFSLVGCLSLSGWPFDAETFLILMMSNLSVSFFFASTFGVISKKLLLTARPMI